MEFQLSPVIIKLKKKFKDGEGWSKVLIYFIWSQHGPSNASVGNISMSHVLKEYDRFYIHNLLKNHWWWLLHVSGSLGWDLSQLQKLHPTSFLHLGTLLFSKFLLFFQNYLFVVWFPGSLLEKRLKGRKFRSRDDTQQVVFSIYLTSLSIYNWSADVV